MRTNSLERLIFFPILSVLSTVVFLASECQAEAMFFGPLTYLSEADSPFDLTGLGTTSFLEDFEDGELNTPGVSSTFAGLVRIPSSSTDSVDSDDGQIDGDGTLGKSLEPTFAFCNHGSMAACSWSLGMNFETVFDGQLPNAVGFVLTDNAPPEDIIVTFYDANGDVITIATESGLGGGLDIGSTDEDRFLGLSDTNGISRIAIRSVSKFEIDHLQYGFTLPTVLCDFSGDGLCDGADINVLMNEAATGGIETDLTRDGIVNNSDRDMWLALAGPENGFAGPYLLGDANLDGLVDSVDLNQVGVNWLRADVVNWSMGNYVADGSLGVNSTDLNGLALNWQRSTASAAAVPEPTAFGLLLLATMFWTTIRRRQTRCEPPR